jgi:hypothetical protein
VLGGGTGSDRAGTAPFRSQGRDGWSGGLSQDAEPLPAGQECLLPGPGAADLQLAGAGVADQPGGQAQQPVAQRVRLGIFEVVAVVQAEQEPVASCPGASAGTRFFSGFTSTADAPASTYSPAASPDHAARRHPAAVSLALQAAGTGCQDHSIREKCESRDSDVLELMFRLVCTISLFLPLFLCVRGMVHFAQACPR